MSDSETLDMTPAIRQAQHNIVTMLCEWELSLSELYRCYGDSFPETAPLWLSLEKEEAFHAKTIDGLHDVIDQGYLLNNIGEFLDETVRHEIEAVQEAIAKVKSGGINQYDAIMTAMSVEASLLDSKFYETVSCDAPAYKRVAEIMVGETRRHIEKMEEIFSHVYHNNRAK